MQPAELKKMVLNLQKVKSESQNIEIKAANLGCPTKLYDTLSSFSNQDDGGIIIFGINEKRLKDYVEAIKAERNNLRNNVTDEQILEWMGVLVDNKPTISGLMTFSLYPQAYFPQLCLPGLK